MKNKKIQRIIRTIILVVSLYFLLIENELSLFIGGIVIGTIFEVVFKSSNKRR